MKNSKYKVLLITIKYSPWILAGIYFLGTILMYFGYIVHYFLDLDLLEYFHL